MLSYWGKRRHHHRHIKASAYKPLKPPFAHYGFRWFFLLTQGGGADEKATRKDKRKLKLKLAARWTKIVGPVQTFKSRRFHPLRCGKVLWNVGHLYSGRARKPLGVKTEKTERYKFKFQMLGESWKAPCCICRSEITTRYTSSNPLEDGSKAEAKGIQETVVCWVLRPGLSGDTYGFKQ